jgi:hypothetical protein
MNEQPPLLLPAKISLCNPETAEYLPNDPRMSLTLADMKKLVPEPKEKMPLPLCRSKA